MELRAALCFVVCAAWVQAPSAEVERFPATPPVAAVELGRDLARGSERPFGPLSGLVRANRPRSVHSVLHDHTAPIGVWFTGWSQKPVEDVTYLSPEVLARWLGFRSQREHWPAEELQRRWNLLRDSFGGKLAFVVRRSAFPKRPFLDIGEPVPADRDSLDQVRFVFTSGGIAVTMEARPLGRVHGDSLGEMDFAWWTTEPFFEALAGEFEQPHQETWRWSGSFTSVWDLVWVAEPEGLRNSFEVRVLTPTREKVASFPRRGR